MAPDKLISYGKYRGVKKAANPQLKKGSPAIPSLKKINKNPQSASATSNRFGGGSSAPAGSRLKKMGKNLLPDGTMAGGQGTTPPGWVVGNPTQPSIKLKYNKATSGGR